MNSSAKRILELADGERSSREIGKLLGLSARYVRRLMLRHGMPQPPVGAPSGKRNPSFRGGRRVDLDGYVSVSLKRGDPHPHQRMLPGKKTGFLLEHRLVMEKKLGRYLTPKEVVDHIDGLTLHNAPENLRLFASNGEHLRETTSGTGRAWSDRGLANIGARTDRGREIQPHDIYHLRKKRGDIRLQQILRAAFQLGIDSPFLLGTHHLLQKAGIDLSSRSSLERAWADLSARWESDLLL